METIISDKLNISNDQTYEEILERFDSQKQRMQESPKNGDSIKYKNSSIFLEEEFCEIITCDETTTTTTNPDSCTTPRQKERVISTKICDDGDNYIKETIIDRVCFTQDGFVVKTKHIIEKFCIEDDRKDCVNKKSDTTEQLGSKSPTAQRSSNFENISRSSENILEEQQGNDSKSQNLSNERSDFPEISELNRNNITISETRYNDSVQITSDIETVQSNVSKLIETTRNNENRNSFSEANVSDSSAMEAAKTKPKSARFSLNDDEAQSNLAADSTNDGEISPLQRLGDEQQSRNNNTSHNDIDNISQLDLEDSSQLDDETPPTGWELSEATKSTADENAKSTQCPMKMVIPLFCIRPTDDVSGRNQRYLVSLSLQYQMCPDGDEDED